MKHAFTRLGGRGREAVLALGFVSLLNDAASEMVFPLLPLFLTTTLGAGPAALGFIEGLAEALASVLKLFAGRWADRVGRNRPFLLAGYGLSAAVKPLVALAGAPGHLLAVRLLDRTGKGLRTSPRDALLAASVPAELRGTAFGLHRAMDHLGAVVGPLLALVILQLGHGDLRLLFALSAVPGALAFLALLRVRDAQTAPGAPSPLGPGTPALRRALVPIGLFTLGGASDAFLMLKAGASAADPLTALPLLWMALHLVRSATSAVGGGLADRIGPRRSIALGWAWYAAICVALAYADDIAVVTALVLLLGVRNGLTEGAEKALVAAVAAPDRRGEAFGLYHLCLGLCALPASFGFGLLWQGLGERAAWLTAAGLSVAALVALSLSRADREARAAP